MFFKVFDFGLDVARLQSLRETIEVLAAGEADSHSGVRFSISRMHRHPRDAVETGFVRDVVKAFWASGIDRLYTRTYDRAPLLLLEHCTIRLQETQADDNYVPWHLDANFYGFDVPMITAWVPLVDVGTDAPGLEFADIADRVSPEELRRLWLSHPVDENGRRALDDDGLRALFGDGVTRRSIRLKVGGFCAFDQTVLHRTQVMPGARKRRSALEYRIADRDHLPRDISSTALNGMLLSWRDRESDRIQIGYSGTLFPQVSGA